jgi:hypothetical protein
MANGDYFFELEGSKFTCSTYAEFGFLGPNIYIASTDESVINDFTMEVNQDCTSWISPRTDIYPKTSWVTDDNGERTGLYLEYGFTIARNNEYERTGTILFKHISGWSATYTIVQPGWLDVQYEKFEIVQKSINVSYTGTGSTPINDLNININNNWGDYIKDEFTIKIDNDCKSWINLGTDFKQLHWLTINDKTINALKIQFYVEENTGASRTGKIYINHIGGWADTVFIYQEGAPGSAGDDSGNNSGSNNPAAPWFEYVPKLNSTDSRLLWNSWFPDGEFSLLTDQYITDNNYRRHDITDVIKISVPKNSSPSIVDEFVFYADWYNERYNYASELLCPMYNYKYTTLSDGSKAFSIDGAPKFIYKENNGNPYITLQCVLSENMFENGSNREIEFEIRHFKNGSMTWGRYIKITQACIPSVNSIPESAYKEIIPGTTPHICASRHIASGFNYGKAEKVLYAPAYSSKVGIDAPGKSVDCAIVVPGATDKTTIDYYITNLTHHGYNSTINKNFDYVGTWLHSGPDYNIFDSHNPIDSNIINWKNVTDTERVYKLYNVGLYMEDSYVKPLFNSYTHTAIKITAVVKNYDNQIGNCIAIPYIVVNVSDNISKQNFEQLVNLYGVSNYDGTMNNLDWLSFEYDKQDTFVSMKYYKDILNIPADAKTHAIVLNIPGISNNTYKAINTYDNSYSSDGGSNWVSDIKSTYKTDTTGNPYLWITFNTKSNDTGKARTCKITSDYKTNSSSIIINQTPMGDTTTDTSNILLKNPLFNGENNINTEQKSSKSSIVLDVFDLTEEECKNVKVYSTANWLNISKITYIKKN